MGTLLRRTPGFGSWVWTLLLLVTATCSSGCTMTEGAFFDTVGSMLCTAYSGCCTSHGWNTGMCDVESSPPEWITNAGASFVPGGADACLTRVQAWINTHVDCTTEASSEYSAGNIVAEVCPDLYVGGNYQTTPLGAPCTGISPCAPSFDGATACATGVATEASGTTYFTECVVWVTSGVLGDVCGYADCGASGRDSSGCLPLRPTTPRWAESCGTGLSCDTTHHCAPMAVPPTAAIGASCMGIPCVPGAWCHASGGTAVCVADSTVGQACTTAYEAGPMCDANAYCSTSGVCMPPAVTVATGAVCDGITTVCAMGVWCDPVHGVCTRPAGGGTPCTANPACASGQCVNGSCTRWYPPGDSDCQ